MQLGRYVSVFLHLVDYSFCTFLFVLHLTKFVRLEVMYSIVSCLIGLLYLVLFQIGF